MKRIFGIIIIASIFFSCEESFSPKGEFEQKYVMNFVIRGDSSLQIATLAKNYDVDGFDPYANSEDINLSKAEIRIWYKDTVYFMTDTILQRTDSSRYPFPVKAFKVSNFKPGFDEKIEVEALLTNGRRLFSETKIATELRFGYDSASAKIPALDGVQLRIPWTNTQRNLIYHPRLRILYYKSSTGKTKIYFHEVAQNYFNINGVEIPNYPQPSKNYGVTFQQSAIDKAMQEISEGDDNKENYLIISAWFEVIIYDKNLSGYYTATNKSAGDLSIRLDESDFSNITGGLGVFGSYIKKGKSIIFDNAYIRSFGYKPSY